MKAMTRNEDGSYTLSPAVAAKLFHAITAASYKLGNAIFPAQASATVEQDILELRRLAEADGMEFEDWT